MGFGSRIYDLRQSLRGHSVARNYLAESQFWPAEKIQEMQYQKLHKLLLHCYDNVPYYKRLFSDSAFNPASDFNSTADLSRIPVMNKNTARAVRELLVSDIHNTEFITDKTSGSTGEPFEINISTEQIVFEKATVWRHWSWAGYGFRTPMAIIRTYVPEYGQPLIKHDAIRNFRYYSAYHLNETNARSYLIDMKKFGAKVIRGYPSSVYILAKFKLEENIELSGIKSILTASETLTDSQRETIEKAFDAKVFNWYGLAEQVVSASECESHQGMHLNNEYGYWELEKRDYLPDNQRMIVGTNFRNYAMPLVRYETGDIAILAENKSCSCGRTLPLIKTIAGRKDDIITTPDGLQIPSVNFYSMFRELSAVQRFQLIQWNINEVEIRIKSQNLDDNEKDRILDELKLRLGKRMKIKLTINKEFERNPEGKRRPVISHVRIGERIETSSAV